MCRAARPGSIAESWTSSERNAEDFAGTTDFRIIIHCHNCKRARDIRPLYKAVVPRQQNIGKPIHMEAEWIYTGEQRFRVVHRHKFTEGKVLYYVYDVEEIVR